MKISTRCRPAALLAVAGATLMVALSLGAWSPGPAQAFYCARGDFCLWEHAYQSGGRYYWHGTDMNLWNDRWVGGSGGVVADQASSLYNNGYTGGYDKVLLYHGSSQLSTCVWPRESAYYWDDLHDAPYYAPNGDIWRFDINDYITGFRWSTTC